MNKLTSEQMVRDQQLVAELLGDVKAVVETIIDRHKDKTVTLCSSVRLQLTQIQLLAESVAYEQSMFCLSLVNQYQSKESRQLDTDTISFLEDAHYEANKDYEAEYSVETYY